MNSPLAASSPASIPAHGPATLARPIIGLDLGGTKCAVSVLRGGRVEEVARIPTGEFEATFRELTAAIASHTEGLPPFFGVSCGGPLDAKSGTILTPPNLPASWHHVAIGARLVGRFGGEAFLMNDANACALAEWRYGAGRGTRHMVFLTSGTGMGAGLVLNGALYEGATGDAGEIGHVRLRPDGPVGYGKAGSVEGFYSGGGIVRMAETLIRQELSSLPVWYPSGAPLSAKLIADAARGGDAVAIDIMRRAGGSLGEAISILIDLFNPEKIVIGGFFPQCRRLLEPAMYAVIEAEALPLPRGACEIVPAALGDTIGSHGAIAAALHAIRPAERPDEPRHR